MPECIILGSGTSNGVPMLGYEYSEEFLANPKNHRTRSSIVILGPSGNLLVDCAPEMRLQMTRERVFDVEAVLITHTHADHVMGMDDLRSLCLKTRSEMPVYSLPPYLDDIRRIYPYAFMDFPPGVFVPRFDLREVPERFEVGGMEVITFVVEHGPSPVVGIRIGDFAYITDVSRIPESAWQKLQGLDTFIVDATRLAPHPNHFTRAQAIETIAALKPRRAYLTHLSHEYDHDVVEPTLPPEVRLAYDGLRLPVVG